MTMHDPLPAPLITNVWPALLSALLRLGVIFLCEFRFLSLFFILSKYSLYFLPALGGFHLLFCTNGCLKFFIPS